MLGYWLSRAASYLQILIETAFAWRIFMNVSFMWTPARLPLQLKTAINMVMLNSAFSSFSTGLNFKHHICKTGCAMIFCAYERSPMSDPSAEYSRLPSLRDLTIETRRALVSDAAGLSQTARVNLAGKNSLQEHIADGRSKMWLESSSFHLVLQQILKLIIAIIWSLWRLKSPQSWRLPRIWQN